MRTRASRCAGPAFAALLLMGSASAALAQEQGTTDESQATVATDDDILLGQALMFDPSSLADDAPARTLKLPGLAHPKSFDVSRTNTQPDGSGTVVVKQALPTDWDAKVGADLGLAGNAPAYYQPLHPLDAPSRDNNSGAAWASIGFSDTASVDARVDPTTDQGRIAGTLRHSMPVGTGLSVTLQNSLSVTDTFGTQGPTAPAGLPMMTLPQDAGSAPSQVFGNEQTVKFNVLPTGTTFGAGVASYSSDPITHNKFSAEQKLLGPLHVTTSVTDVGQETMNKSISAGFKLNW